MSLKINLVHFLLLISSYPIRRIEQDPTAEPDEHGDRRRIVHLFETTLDKAAPIHLQQPRVTHDHEE